MIIDKIENIEKYASINPLFPKAIEYLKTVDINSIEVSKTTIVEGELMMNVALVKPKTKETARLETHCKFIDIQIPITGEEIMGYTPTADCQPKDAAYDNAKDITFYEGPAESYITVKPGMFAIFFPEDGHAPGITPVELKKIIFKVKN